MSYPDIYLCEIDGNGEICPCVVIALDEESAISYISNKYDVLESQVRVMNSCSSQTLGSQCMYSIPK